MKARFWFVGGIALFVAACDDVQGSYTTPSEGDIAVLPEGVVAIAAPNQNLNAVRINATDGCYVYRYAGPVETTYLPLRTVDGRPICSRPADAPVTG